MSDLKRCKKTKVYPVLYLFLFLLFNLFQSGFFGRHLFPSFPDLNNCFPSECVLFFERKTHISFLPTPVFIQSEEVFLGPLFGGKKESDLEGSTSC